LVVLRGNPLQNFHCHISFVGSHVEQLGRNKRQLPIPTAMAPAAMHNEKDYGDVSMQILDRAIFEIERMRELRLKEDEESAADEKLRQRRAAASRFVDRRQAASLGTARRRATFKAFPPACLNLLRKIDGNHRCIDCGEHDPQWAAVSYGALLCLQCSGHHRSLGVHVSLVRSVTMDEWSLEQVLAMLEGGNGQLAGFFGRHHLTTDTCLDTSKTVTRDNVTRLRYKTKAALFYRQQMNVHVSNVLAAGPYRGRETSRNRRCSSQQIERRNSE
jgi:Putative GTPase activating protein for Arf